MKKQEGRCRLKEFARSSTVTSGHYMSPFIFVKRTVRTLNVNIWGITIILFLEYRDE